MTASRVAIVGLFACLVGMWLAPADASAARTLAARSVADVYVHPAATKRPDGVVEIAVRRRRADVYARAAVVNLGRARTLVTCRLRIDGRLHSVVRRWLRSGETRMLRLTAQRRVGRSVRLECARTSTRSLVLIPSRRGYVRVS